MFTNDEISALPYATVEDVDKLNTRYGGKYPIKTFCTAQEYFEALSNRATNRCSQAMDAGRETPYLVSREAVNFDMHEYIEIEGGPLVKTLDTRMPDEDIEDFLEDLGIKRNRCFCTGLGQTLYGLDLHRGPVFVPANTLVVMR